MNLVNCLKRVQSFTNDELVSQTALCFYRKSDTSKIYKLYNDKIMKYEFADAYWFDTLAKEEDFTGDPDEIVYTEVPSFSVDSLIATDWTYEY